MRIIHSVGTVQKTIKTAGARAQDPCCSGWGWSVHTSIKNCPSCNPEQAFSAASMAFFFALSNFFCSSACRSGSGEWAQSLTSPPLCNMRVLAHLTCLLELCELPQVQFLFSLRPVKVFVHEEVARGGIVLAIAQGVYRSKPLHAWDLHDLDCCQGT